MQYLLAQYLSEQRVNGIKNTDLLAKGPVYQIFYTI